MGKIRGEGKLGKRWEKKERVEREHGLGKGRCKGA